MKNESLFELLSKINVNDKTEKKNGLTYLSWSWAWSEFKKHCPNGQYEIIRDEKTGFPYMVDEFGIMVSTRVTANDETHEMWLPVMDGAHKSMKREKYSYFVNEWKNGRKTGNMIEKFVEPATMFDINTAIMRCLVKNLAMFGLGIYIYSGEDLPDGWTPPKPTIDKKRFENALQSIYNLEYTSEKLIEKFALTSEQIEQLNSVIQKMEKLEQNKKAQTQKTK